MYIIILPIFLAVKFWKHEKNFLSISTITLQQYECSKRVDYRIDCNTKDSIKGKLKHGCPKVILPLSVEGGVKYCEIILKTTVVHESS